MPGKVQSSWPSVTAMGWRDAQILVTRLCMRTLQSDAYLLAKLKAWAMGANIASPNRTAPDM